MHSRNWCPNRKVSVPADGRQGDSCPVCGLPFADAFEQPANPFEVPEPVAPPPEPDTTTDIETIEDIVTTSRTTTPSAPSASAPSGWYPDPASVPGRLRYWDGDAWTTRTRTPNDAEPGSGAAWLFFSFSGRANRGNYWTVVVTAWLVLFVGVAASDGLESSGADGAAGLVALVVFVFWGWSLIAVSVKRWHDRDKPGVMVLINLIPFIGWLWAFVELGLLPGTEGPNSYGAEPL